MLTHSYAADLMGHCFRGVPDTPPAQVYVNLLRSWTTNEITEATADEVTSLARQAVTMGPPDGAGLGSSGTGVTWTTTEQVIALAMAFYDAPTGGRLLAWEPLKVPIVTNVGGGDVIEFPAGSIVANMKSRLTQEFDWTAIPEIYGYWWAGYRGENCSMKATAGADAQEVTRLWDQSGKGNHLDGAYAENPGMNFGLQIPAGTRGGPYSTAFPTIGANHLGGTHFQNVYLMQSPEALSGPFYLICAFLNTRDGGDRFMWGATDANDYVRLAQVPGSMHMLMGGVRYDLAAVGDVPEGLNIVEIQRNQANVLVCRVNGSEVSRQTAAGTFNLTGWGDDGNSGPNGNSNQWDDDLLALAVCIGFPSDENRAGMYLDLEEIWKHGRYDFPRCGWTNYGADLVYKHTFNGSAFPVPAGGYHVALAHMQPGDDATGASMNELDEAGYQRAALTVGDDPRARGSASNSVTLDHGTADDRWTRLPAHWCIVSGSARGTGNAFFWGPYLAATYIKQGTPVRSYPGDLNILLSQH